MLADNPLLTLLGRRGRGAVIEALLAAPGRDWTVRGLARQAGVPPAVASRTVQELAALGAVETFRPGRAAVVRLEARSTVTRILRELVVPDLRRGAVAAFAAAYLRPPGTTLLHWTQPGDDPADPLCPARIAVVVRRGEDAALDAVGPALDAALAAGWPRPEVTPFSWRQLDEDDPVARAVRSGSPL